jgi:flagellar hook-basal body complex protein FliE
MAINGIGAVAGAGGMQRPGGAQELGGLGAGRMQGAGRLGENGGGTSFADSLKSMLGQVSGLQDEAKDAIGAFMRGEQVELHRVMAATEEAGIALDMLIELRNKLAEAYRTVMAMQS